MSSWSDTPKILVIGLGQIGWNTAEYMSSKALIVHGWDVDRKAVQRALNHEIIGEEASTFEGYDYYVICISTHNPDNMFEPYLDGLYEIAHRLSYEGKPGSLLSIESTVLRGTSYKVMKILNHRLHVAHFPHRFYAHEKEQHGVKQTRVLGGCESCCINEATSFYRKLLDIPIHPISSVEFAELSKIVENAYRFLEIAFAEELKITCDLQGIDFDELRTAINTKWNINILEARDGIEGHCLPKDSKMYLQMTKNLPLSSLIDAAIAIDHQYKIHIGRVRAKRLSLGELLYEDVNII